MKKMVLASKSQRRIDIMKMVGLEFTVAPADIDETLDEELPLEYALAQLATKKCLATQTVNKLVIAADTVCVFDGKILTKPLDKREAMDFLRALSGREHHVLTGFCCLDSDTAQLYASCEATVVKFRELTETMIDDYVSHENITDYAGGYNIYGRGALFVEKIDGDFFNVMGLPIGRIMDYINERG